jgi:cysteine desulfurase
MPEIYLDSHTASQRLSQEQLSEIDQAAHVITRCLGASSSKLLFTSSGAEAISHVFSSVYLDQVRETGRSHFLTTGIEDSSILMGLKHLKKLECHTKMLPVDQAGRLRAEVLEEAISPRTVMLSLALSSPLTGVIQPIADLARVCKEKEILLHVDVSCALGKIFFSFEDFGIDFLTFDGSLLDAPKGTGGILIRRGLSLSPFIHGNPPFNASQFTALSAAMKEAEEKLDYLCTETSRLRHKFEETIKEKIPEAVVFFQDSDRLPNTSVVAFPKIASELLAFHLQKKGVFVSFGGGMNQHLSSILRTCGIQVELALCALSFALSHKTTEEEIDKTLLILIDTVNELRKYYD